MMPNLCSFVGVDTKTDLIKLQTMSHTSATRIEWGVLYSPGRAGHQNRYPSYDFVKEFLLKESTIMKSLHLCGEAIDLYLKHDPELFSIIEKSDARVQLNFSMAKYDKDFLTDTIVELCVNHDLILQHNKSKAKFVTDLIKALETKYNRTGMVDILYDGSGGFGRVIEKFDPPIPHYFTGYAGGINPENVKPIVNSIAKLAKDNYYIDMESGVRTDDLLDLDKCRAVIKVLEKIHDEEVFA